MAQIETLLTQMQAPSDERMRAEGYALWMVWQGELNPVVSQFMQEYGGLVLESNDDQALLFFFSSNVFLASARLESWSRFDATTLTIAVMPASLVMGDNRLFRLDMAQELRAQELPTPSTFCIWIHPDIAPNATAIPGITSAEKTPPATLAPLAWKNLNVDPRLPYQAAVGWYSILRPLGNPLDKEFQTGWRALFEEIEKILQRNKFRYTVHDFFLMFPLENLRQLQVWTRSFLETIAMLREQQPEAYWPCVIAIVDKKGLSFNNDLPSKAGLDWNLLAADHPYMYFRNALSVGEDFSIHEVRFATGNGPDDWCNLSLLRNAKKGSNSLPLLIPGSLALGDHPVCFYCGLRSHIFTECPTRTLPERDKDIWRRVAGFDFHMMKDGMRTLDEAVKNEGLEAVPALLSRDDPAGVMGKAIFDINHPFQLRSLSQMWRVRGKNPPGASMDTLDTDSHPIWDIVSAYPESEDKGAVERTLHALLGRYPRDFRIKSLLGFIALERGDPQKATALWKDAEGMAPAGFSQAWHLALQARAMECSGKASLASPLYGQASRACENWLFPEYRRIVCQVKTGFADNALTQIANLLRLDANFFNMSILDSEMERGQIQILTGLGEIWVNTEEQMAHESTALARLTNELSLWFTPEHPFAEQGRARISKLKDLTHYCNYVPYIAAIHGRSGIERDMQQVISRESREFRNKFKGYLNKLAYIQKEAAWFPFPRIMSEFNKNYNQCAASLNWALQSNLHTPEAFRRALLMATGEEDRILHLEKRLKFLRLIRDTTLFFLTLAKTFFWIEVVGLLLVLVVLPLFLFYAQKTGLPLPFGELAGQQWQVQKGATFIVSFLAITVAMLRTVLRFDKIRDAILEKARQAEQAKHDSRRKAAEKLVQDKKRKK